MKETEKRNIIITGGEFNNKGAQAMSFITISRLKEKFPEHNIIFASIIDANRSKKELSKYNFEIVPDPLTRNNFLCENIIRKILGKNLRKNPKEYKNILSNTDYVFDISGYALSSQWGKRKSKNYLKKFEIAHDKGIKTVILPQSIGPFNFGEDSLKMNEMLYETLSKVNIIMPREREGMENLSKLGIKNNIFYSPDLVLTNKKEVNWTHIYKNKVSSKKYDIPDNSVAIVPNMRNFDHGNSAAILDLYKSMVSELLGKGKNVYLIRHSGEDLKVCKMVKNLFSENRNVKIISDDLTPSEFQDLISKFEFSIGSRFHSVVHSFKVGTPCIILGWATKYKELAKLFGQENYVFDVRNNIDTSLFIKMMNQLTSKLSEEKSKINKGLQKVESMKDPFDKAFESITQD